jgi:acyl carrier protein
VVIIPWRSETMVFEKVRGIIAEELGIEEDTIKLESDISEDLGADSLDAIELIMEVESRFEVEIADNEAAKIKKVSDIVNYLEALSK